MSTATTITPSPEARQLFNIMVARSDGDGKLPMYEALKLSNEFAEKGINISTLTIELIQEEWIVPSYDGGVAIALFPDK